MSTSPVPITFSGPLDAAMPAGAHVQALLTPNQGYDCYVLAQWIEPGAAGLALHTHAVDQYFYVVDGEMSIQLGSERFTARSGAFIHVPPGIPHRSWNAGTEDERHIELIVPGPPLASLSSPAEARLASGASEMFRTLGRGHPYKDARVDIHFDDWPAHEARSIQAASRNLILLVLAGTLTLGTDDSIETARAHCLVPIKHGHVLPVCNPGPSSVSCLSIELPMTS